MYGGPSATWRWEWRVWLVQLSPEKAILRLACLLRSVRSAGELQHIVRWMGSRVAVAASGPSPRPERLTLGVPLSRIDGEGGGLILGGGVGGPQTRTKT